VLSTLSANHSLRLLDTEARESLSPVDVQLRAREVLYEPGTPAMYVYFPVNAVISIVSTMENGASTEVAVVGREGMVGIASVLGTVESLTTAVVQIARTAVRASTSQLRSERLRRSSIRTMLDRYTEARLIQVAQTAACNRLHSVEARLARWLLAIAKVLNHIEGGRAATCIIEHNAYDTEKRDALERWARRLTTIVEGHTTKVPIAR
jgi:CRP-like cAMP-binding protein